MPALTMTPATPLTSVEPFLRCTVGAQAGCNHSSTDIFLANAEHLGALTEVAGLIGPESTIFVPENSILGSDTNGARVVEYAGDCLAPGEIVLDDEDVVRLENYRDSAGLAISGPTVLRIDSEVDYLAFLADADRALTTGEFPAHLLDPNVWLADACCLAGGTTCPGLSRLFVSETGELRTSLRGRVVGIVGDGVKLALHAGGRPCACADIPAAAHVSALAEWPWLPRYVAALQALRRMRAYDRRQCRVSGFGTRLVPGLGLDRVEAPTVPLLVWDRAGCVVFSLASQRAVQITAQDGRLLELAFVGGSRVAAAILAERQLGIDAMSARRGIERVLGELADRGLDCSA